MQKPWPYFKSQQKVCLMVSIRSSRLHNKAYIDKLSGRSVLSDGQKSQVNNQKFYLIFHTEFILDQQESFLNIMDPEGTSQKWPC